jgi:hypothetical protein
MKLDQAKAIEALIQTLPGAFNMRNGKMPPKLMPGQEAVESKLTISRYMIPVMLDGSNKTHMISMKFEFDERLNQGLIIMKKTDIDTLAGKEKKAPTAQSMYRVFKEDDKRLKANITCYKCGHVIEHECW